MPSLANIPVPVVLNQGQFCFLGDIYQCLETFLVVTSGWRVEAKDSPKHPAMHRTAAHSPPQKMFTSKCQLCEVEKPCSTWSCPLLSLSQSSIYTSNSLSTQYPRQLVPIGTIVGIQNETCWLLSRACWGNSNYTGPESFGCMWHKQYFVSHN